MARATPMLGNEGPFGPQLGMTAYNDVRFGSAGRLDRGLKRACCVLTSGTASAFRWWRSIFMAVHFWRIQKGRRHLGSSSGNARVGDESAEEEIVNSSDLISAEVSQRT